MTEPRTAAGKALPGQIETILTVTRDPFAKRELIHAALRKGIVAIEAEARAIVVKAIRAKFAIYGEGAGADVMNRATDVSLAEVLKLLDALLATPEATE